MKEIDIEDLVKRIGWRGKHADKLIVVGETLVIIEETATAKIGDLKQLEETVNATLHGPLKTTCSYRREKS